MSIVGGYGKNGFDAYGEEILRAEHLRLWMDSPLRVDPDGVSFALEKSIGAVEDGFFLLFPTLRELLILNPDCDIAVSDETACLFRSNRVLIRGDFDGKAEKLAKACGLRFLHADVRLGATGDARSREGSEIATLCFRPDGSACIHLDQFCPGPAADWDGGGELEIGLPKDFYLGMDAASVAEASGSRCREEIAGNESLRAFLKKAREKGGFFLDFSAE